MKGMEMVKMRTNKHFYRIGKPGLTPQYMVAAANLNEAIEKARKVLHSDVVYARRMYRTEDSDVWMF